jgi:CzcA family heavy metal efflux pump
MMRSIIKSSMQFRYLVIVIAGVMLISGITKLREMPLDVLPEFSPPFVEIQTEALGLSAEEVEQMITVPLEQDLLAGVAWIDVIRSESVPGLSSVVIYFEPGTDLYRARQMVSERLAQAAVGIPHVSKPPAMIQPTSSASRFMIIGLSSKKLSLIDMGVLARWTIGPRLLGVPGVANVAIWGNRDRQLQVLVDPKRLQDRGVTLDQVIGTTGNALWVSSLSFLEASSPGTGGFIDTSNQRLGIWHVLPISSPEELAQVPVEGTSLTLGDVTEVVEDHQPLIGDAIVNDTSNLLLVIEKLPGINTLEVTKGVEDALVALKPGFADIEFDATLFRPATFLEMAISNLTTTLVISALLAILILGLLFYGWRTTLISLVAILISLVAALFVLYLRGATLNSMVLAGLVIALGLIIDDAIVDVEHIVRRLRQNRREDSPKSTESIILEASAEMRGLLFFATLITLLAIVPVLFISGTSGAVFLPMAISYVLAVLAALVVALTVTPVLSLLFLSNPRVENRASPLISWLQRGYERLLKNSIQRPKLVYAVAVVLIVAALAVLPGLGQGQMLPTFRESYLLVQLEAAPATSLPEMNRIVARMSSELRAIPGVSNVGAHIGRAVLGDQVVGINSAELWVSINPAGNYEATVAAIRETVNGYPGLSCEMRNYSQETLLPLKISTSDPFTVRVYGEEHKVLVSEAEKLHQVLAGINGVVESHVLLPIEEPILEIEVDLDKAQQYGVKPGDVRRAAATLISGLQVGSLFEQQKVFDVVVWGTPKTHQNLAAIRDLLIDTPGGGHVRLGDVADVHVSAAPTVIQREAISPYIDIGFDIRGRANDAVKSDIKTAMKNFTFPLEYHAEMQEDYAVQRAAGRNILISALLAAIGIFLLLQASFISWRLALATFLTLPIVLTGGVLAAFLSGGSVPLVALFGLFAVLGIGARNGVLLIRHYQSLEQEGEIFGPGLVLRGSLERLAPLATTTLTTGLTLLPFMLFGNIPGHEIVRPMAIVIVGGLITSAFLNLVLLPYLYLRLGAGRKSELEHADQELQPVAAGNE